MQQQQKGPTGILTEKEEDPSTATTIVKEKKKCKNATQMEKIADGSDSKSIHQRALAKTQAVLPFHTLVCDTPDQSQTNSSHSLSDLAIEISEDDTALTEREEEEVERPATPVVDSSKNKKKTTKTISPSEFLTSTLKKTATNKRKRTEEETAPQSDEPLQKKSFSFFDRPCLHFDTISGRLTVYKGGESMFKDFIDWYYFYSEKNVNSLILKK
jgi:hypothetical protein